MHILHLYKDYYPVLGGIENYIKVLAEAHAAAGHRVTVLVCHPGSRTDRQEVEGVTLIRAGRLATVASMPLSLRQPLLLTRLRPDVLHVHSLSPGRAQRLGTSSHASPGDHVPFGCRPAARVA